jgi:hypothetical protein
MFRFSKRDWAQLLGLLLVAVAVVSVVLISDGLLEEDFWPETVAVADEPSVENFNPRVVIRREFPPITDAPVISAREAVGKVDNAELVLGVQINGQARAYPLNMLTGPSREIINDTLGDTAIAATW